MAQSMILAEFEKLVRTPADVARLNEAILELAVRGRLVAQDPSDEPASALLARIRAEKTRLEEAGEIRKAKPLAKVKAEEMPFALPDGWVWCRFGNICIVERGITFPASAKETLPFDGGIVCLRTTNVQAEVDWSDLLYISEEYVKSDAKILRVDDILISMANSYALVGKVALVNSVPFPATFGGFIAAIRRYGDIHPRFLYLALTSPYIQAVFRESSSQTTNIANISLRTMYPMLFPLPPLAEQQRIVERVESLLAATAALKGSLATAQAEGETLTAAALHRLESAADPAQSAAAWALIRENFVALIDTPQSVAALKQTILQLAVQGKLVPQEATDEPASALLARIRAEKERLEEAGEIRKSKPLAKVNAEEMPFALPDGWVWARLGEIVTVRGGKRLPKGYTFASQPTDHIYIRVTDMKDGSIDDGALQYIDEEVYNAIERYTIEKSDLYITIAGTIGQIGEVPERFHGMNLTENAAKLSPHLVDRKFLKQFLNSPFIQMQFDAKVNKMAQPKLALIRIQTTYFPVPPLAEQQRIVARVEALFALCDGLAAGLEEGEGVRGRWVAAVLAGV